MLSFDAKLVTAGSGAENAERHMSACGVKSHSDKIVVCTLVDAMYEGLQAASGKVSAVANLTDYKGNWYDLCQKTCRVLVKLYNEPDVPPTLERLEGCLQASGASNKIECALCAIMLVSIISSMKRVIPMISVSSDTEADVIVKRAVQVFHNSILEIEVPQ